jgi:MFS family permease
MVQEAGLPSTSMVSVIAGALAAFGVVGIILALTGAVGNQLGISTGGVSTEEWQNMGIGAAAAVSVVLFGAFFFGGYTAGRMSRRTGASHGAAVFAFGVLVVAVIVGLTAWSGTTETIRDSLVDNDVPTDAATWSGIAVGAVIAAVAATLLGAVLGGIRGERWHGRVEARANEARTPRTIDLTEPANQPSLEEEREQRAEQLERTRVDALASERAQT